jgi:hypothetical protein
VEATWDAPAEKAPRRAALQRVAQRVALDAMMDLAARPEAAPEVRASVLWRLSLLRGRLEEAWRNADPAARAHVWLAAKDLGEFLDHPEVRSARPGPPTVPPGRPIGGALQP